MKTARECVLEEIIKLSKINTGLNDADYLELVIETCINGAEKFGAQFFTPTPKTK